MEESRSLSLLYSHNPPHLVFLQVFPLVFFLWPLHLQILLLPSINDTFDLLTFVEVIVLGAKVIGLLVDKQSACVWVV
ncbi:hypothetical protein CR513_07563, partial [Mucuna pruriens]